MCAVTCYTEVVVYTRACHCDDNHSYFGVGYYLYELYKMKLSPYAGRERKSSATCHLVVHWAGMLYYNLSIICDRFARKKFVVIITPFVVLLLVYKADARGRVAPEGEAL